MNTSIRGTCRSIDFNGFDSAADDGWFLQHTAPMDGEEETGAHPHQAAALQSYLKRGYTPLETAAAITTPNPHYSENKADLRCRVLGIMEDALFELPECHTPALVDLLKEINQLPGEEDGVPIWKGLGDLGHSWSDRWKHSHWRQELATRDPATRAKRREAYVHLAFVEASCAMAAPGPNAEDGILPLSWGYECISEALECQHAVWDFEVPAATVWIRIAGERLREGARKGERSWALERVGRLWTAGPMSMDRWDFWLRRLEEIEEIGKVILTTAREGVRDGRAQNKE